MIIESIRVEEGFLHDLNLELAEGLNVLVGARGSGKTSVIELIRFCLGADTVTEQAAERSRRHALSVLGSGKVSVTLVEDGMRYTVSRTADDAEPQADDPLPRVTILAQNEIERVGLQEVGRLRLLDAFLPESAADRKQETRLIAQLRSLSLEARELHNEIDQAREQMSALSKVPVALKAARVEEEKVLRTTTASKADRNQLQKLQASSADVTLKSGLVSQNRQRIEKWHAQLVDVADAAPEVEAWPDAASGRDLLKGLRSELPRIIGLVDDAVTALGQTLEALAAVERTLTSERSATSEATRAIRVRLERMQAGAGAATRRVQALQEQAGQLTALKSLRTNRAQRLRAVTSQRDRLLDEMAAIQQNRFVARNRIAKRINKALGPRIHAEVIQGAIDRPYQDAIAEALRGSGLHYTSLAPLLAENMSPRELVSAVEGDDAAAVVTATGVSTERCERIIAHLRANGLDSILVAPIEDGVRLTLLDGSEYKPTPSLSTGQRCTVVLPIVLSHRGTPVIVDQPEDHLDNAFIADTVIAALRSRVDGDQILVSTHNANIPVLGDADRVVVLGSDGKRGFIKDSGQLDSPTIVEAISTVMEGGREAFAQRASYYGDRRGPQ